MTIKYEYQIAKIDETAKTMEVLFTSEGRRPYRISMPLPKEGQDIERLVFSYSPVPRWAQEEGVFVTPSVGTKGVFDPEVANQKTDEQLKQEARVNRQRMMQAVADPIYFKWQRGEATEQEWLDAVASVRAAFPYPEEV